MRESNFAFPAQNKACVCITSQLYDRRALDTTSPLPLFNSLTHLTYLTSTSPRIREIMTMDGGLERLVRILHDFCLSPPPPENPTLLYGLTPPNARPPKPVPQLNPHSYDKHAAYRFSLAFQCVVNIGVRGSEEIRRRVVQAGTLDVVGCILEAWLASKGFAVGPSSSATGLPRETREQRQARRTAQMEQRQREEATAIARALQRQIHVEQLTQRNHREHIRWHNNRAANGIEGFSVEDDSMDISPTGNQSQSIARLGAEAGPSASSSDTDISTDHSTTITPLGSTTPTGTVVVPSRDRSGTIIARTVWDPPALANGTNVPIAGPSRPRQQHTVEPRRDHDAPSPSASTDTSRPDTETEDDGDGDVEMDNTGNNRMGHAHLESDIASASASASPSPERPPHPRLPIGRRAVGIVSDAPDATGLPVGNMNMGMPLAGDVHIIINEAGGVGVGDGTVGVEDGIVSLEQNDDFAMGAPPGAPGAMDEGTTPRGLTLAMEAGRRRNAGQDAPDVTPRAGVISLPPSTAPSPAPLPSPGFAQAPLGHQRNATIRGRPNPLADGALLQPPGRPTPTTNAAAAAAAAATTAAPGLAASFTIGRRPSNNANHHHRDVESGPYRDEDVLLSLQLLAYLSKYPHVRQAFYKPRVTFHPASVNLPGGRYGMVNKVGEVSGAPASPIGKDNPPKGFYQTFGPGVPRGKEKASAGAGPSTSTTATTPSILAGSSLASAPVRQTNVFSLVERFTFKPSSTETDLPNPPPRLPPEIQYWAGVIMRNACRKDESRGGIRQCANMLCGRWESYPREFAKCRRCRKAKYCGKECQSTAWSEGHRFWCSARDGDEDTEHHPIQQTLPGSSATAVTPGDQDLAQEGVTGDEGVTVPVVALPGPSTTRAERRERRERHHAAATAAHHIAAHIQQHHHHHHNPHPQPSHPHALTSPSVGPEPTLRPTYRPTAAPPPPHSQSTVLGSGPIPGPSNSLAVPPNAPFIPPGILAPEGIGRSASPTNSGGFSPGMSVSRQSSTSTVRMRPRLVVPPPVAGSSSGADPLAYRVPADWQFTTVIPGSESGPSSSVGASSSSASTSTSTSTAASPISISPISASSPIATRRRMENTSAYRMMPVEESRDMVIG